MSVSVRGWVYSLAVVGLDDGDAVVEVERRDPLGPALVQVDRAGVDQLAGPVAIDGADQRAVGEGDAELVGRRPPRRPTERARPPPAGPDRRGLARARPGRGAQAELVVDHEVAHAVVEQVGPPALVGVGQRRLVGRARQVGEQRRTGWRG